MEFKKATDADIPGILKLQHENFVGNLTDQERQDGFLSVEFNQAQFKQMNDESGVIVCKDDSQIHGYLCTSSLAFNLPFALPAAMIALFPKCFYHGKSLDQYNVIMAGPWCIGREYRGKNVFIDMWNALGGILPKEIELITTFISANNPRSLHAARKIQMNEITTFQHDGKEFILLAADTKSFRQ